MPCKSVSFKLGFCVRKRAWYQWEELATTVIPCYVKGCSVKNGEGKSWKQPGTTKLCVVIHLGEKLRYCSQLTGRNNLLASENFTQKGKVFFLLLPSVGICFNICGILCTFTRNWCILIQQTAAYSSSSFPMGKCKQLNCWWCFMFHGKSVSSTA